MAGLGHAVDSDLSCWDRGYLAIPRRIVCAPRTMVSSSNKGTEEVVAVKSLRCLVGRHDWRPGVNKDGQPYEVCVWCKHHRYPDSGGSRFSSDVNLPPTEGSTSGNTMGGIGGF